jgi:putative chitinase
MDDVTLARCTSAQIDRAQLFAEPLTAAMGRFEINTSQRQACFLATVSIESDRLEDLEEGLSYSSAERLRLIFPSLFGSGRVDPAAYVRNPKGLSQLRYGGFHGRGLIQLTWEKNYRAAGDALGFDYVTNPDLLLQPEHASLTAAWFFADFARCLADADGLDMASITGKVNGPQRLKLAERRSQMNLALKFLP